MITAIAREREGIVEVETLEGIRALMAFSRSPSTGWTVAVAVPRAVLMSRLHWWTAWLAASCVAMLAVGVLFARVLARRIAGAIDALVEPAMALGAGRPVAATALPVEEADAVGRALQRASQLLLARTSERDAAALAAAASRDEAQRFAHAAQHDALTGVLNRAAFQQHLTRATQACSATGARLAVLFLDIDDFKPVNDLHGHAMGDELLRDFAARLRAGVRAHDIVARLGGDRRCMCRRASASRAIRRTARRQRNCSLRPTRRCTAPRAAASGAPRLPNSRRCNDLRGVAAEWPSRLADRAPPAQCHKHPVRFVCSGMKQTSRTQPR